MNKNAIHILEKNFDKIDWYDLSINEFAINLLKENKDKINWTQISTNYSIFILDKEKMSDKIKFFAEELIQYVFNPDRLSKISKTYKIKFIDLIQIY